MTLPSVLVVDPNPATFRRVEEALHDAGFGLLSARDAREAEERADGTELALVISAASLPKGNGYDLARSLRDQHPAASVLLMTGGFEVYNRDRASEAGVSGHINKPFTPERLRSAVEEALGPLPGALDTLPGDSVAELTDEVAPAPEPRRPEPRGPEPARHRPLASDERVATIIPRDYQDLPVVQVDPAVVAPQIERAILEVLPEVVEVVLRRTLATSDALRELVEKAVADAVADRLSEVAERVVRQRLAEIEAQASEEAS